MDVPGKNSAEFSVSKEIKKINYQQDNVCSFDNSKIITDLLGDLDIEIKNVFSKLGECNEDLYFARKRKGQKDIDVFYKKINGLKDRKNNTDNEMKILEKIIFDDEELLEILLREKKNIEDELELLDQIKKYEFVEFKKYKKQKESKIIEFKTSIREQDSYKKYFLGNTNLRMLEKYRSDVLPADSDAEYEKILKDNVPVYEKLSAEYDELKIIRNNKPNNWYKMPLFWFKGYLNKNSGFGLDFLRSFFYDAKRKGEINQCKKRMLCEKEIIDNYRKKLNEKLEIGLKDVIKMNVSFDDVEKMINLTGISLMCDMNDFADIVGMVKNTQKKILELSQEVKEKKIKLNNNTVLDAKKRNKFWVNKEQLEKKEIEVIERIKTKKEEYFTKKSILREVESLELSLVKKIDILKKEIGIEYGDYLLGMVAEINIIEQNIIKIKSQLLETGLDKFFCYNRNNDIDEYMEKNNYFILTPYNRNKIIMGKDGKLAQKIRIREAAAEKIQSMINDCCMIVVLIQSGFCDKGLNVEQEKNNLEFIKKLAQIYIGLMQDINNNLDDSKRRNFGKWSIEELKTRPYGHLYESLYSVLLQAHLMNWENDIKIVSSNYFQDALKNIDLKIVYCDEKIGEKVVNLQLTGIKEEMSLFDKKKKKAEENNVFTLKIPLFEELLFDLEDREYARENFLYQRLLGPIKISLEKNSIKSEIKTDLSNFLKRFNIEVVMNY